MGVGADPSDREHQVGDNPLAADNDGDPHLRSSRHILGYELQAGDGYAGEVDDLIVDDQERQVRFLVARVDPGRWISRARHLVAAEWLQELDWESRKLAIDLSRGQIEDCPEFDPMEPANRECEQRLYDYYGRPRYQSSETEDELRIQQ